MGNHWLNEQESSPLIDRMDVFITEHSKPNGLLQEWVLSEGVFFASCRMIGRMKLSFRELESSDNSQFLKKAEDFILHKASEIALHQFNSLVAHEEMIYGFYREETQAAIDLGGKVQELEKKLESLHEHDKLAYSHYQMQLERADGLQRETTQLKEKLAVHKSDRLAVRSGIAAAVFDALQLEVAQLKEKLAAYESDFGPLPNREKSLPKMKISIWRDESVSDEAHLKNKAKHYDPQPN